MEYFTVLWITILSGPLEGPTSGLIYNSLAQCEAAIAPVVGTVVDQYDYSVLCEETTKASVTIRPKRNPIYEEN